MNIKPEALWCGGGPEKCGSGITGIRDMGGGAPYTTYLMQNIKKWTANFLREVK